MTSFPVWSSLPTAASSLAAAHPQTTTTTTTTSSLGDVTPPSGSASLPAVTASASSSPAAATTSSSSSSSTNVTSAKMLATGESHLNFLVVRPFVTPSAVASPPPPHQCARRRGPFAWQSCQPSAAAAAATLRSSVPSPSSFLVSPSEFDWSLEALRSVVEQNIGDAIAPGSVTLHFEHSGRLVEIRNSEQLVFAIRSVLDASGVATLTARCMSSACSQQAAAAAAAAAATTTTTFASPAKPHCARPRFLKKLFAPILMLLLLELLGLVRVRQWPIVLVLFAVIAVGLAVARAVRRRAQAFASQLKDVATRVASLAQENAVARTAVRPSVRHAAPSLRPAAAAAAAAAAATTSAESTPFAVYPPVVTPIVAPVAAPTTVPPTTPAPAPAPAAVEASTRSLHNFRESVAKLESLGFRDTNRNIHVLLRCGGDVQAAVNMLLGVAND